MNCSNCGAALIEGAKFCGECGASEPHGTLGLPPTSGIGDLQFVKGRRVAILAAIAILLAASVYYFYSNQKSSDELYSDFPWPVTIGDKCGYIDKTGKLIIGLQFVGAQPFDKDGMAPARIDRENWGYINQKGNWVIPPRFSWAETFSKNGLAWVSVQHSVNNGFIDRSGKLVISWKRDDSFEYAMHIQFFQDRAEVSRNKRWGYLDKKGNYAIPPQFEGAGSFLDSDLAPVKIGGLWGYINRVGEVQIKPQFDLAGGFKNGFAVIEQAGRWGFIDEYGRFAINPQYDNAGSFSKFGLAAIQSGGKWGFINSVGNVIIAPEFDEIAFPTLYGWGDRRFIPVRKGNWWGYLDLKEEKVTIQPQFNGATTFGTEGLASVKVGDKWGFIDHFGQIIISPQFDSPFCSVGLNEMIQAVR